MMSNVVAAAPEPPLAPAVVADAEAEPRWPLARRFAVRFAFLCTLVGLIPFPFDKIPGSDPVTELFVKPLRACAWLAAPLTGYHGRFDVVLDDGSGDRLFDWTLWLGVILAALVVATVWSLVDRRRPRLPWLERAVRVYVRYWLAYHMLQFGLQKVLLAQMPAPSMSKLDEPLGDLSPMSLLWSFMGASPFYERFAGFMEVGAALLLLSRYTALMGLLATAGVLVNVLALNLCYDVPVKLFAATLLVSALALAAYDLRWLLPALLRRPVPPRAPAWRPTSLRGQRWLALGELAAALAVMATGERMRERVTRRPTVVAWSLRGRWRVDRQRLAGRERSALVTDGQRWRQVVLDAHRSRKHMVITLGDDTRELRWLAVDDAKHTLTFLDGDGHPQSTPAPLQASQSDADHLTLRDASGDFAVELTRLPARSYPLAMPSFHWVLE